MIQKRKHFLCLRKKIFKKIKRSHNYKIRTIHLLKLHNQILCWTSMPNLFHLDQLLRQLKIVTQRKRMMQMRKEETLQILIIMTIWCLFLNLARWWFLTLCLKKLIQKRNQFFLRTFRKSSLYLTLQKNRVWLEEIYLINTLISLACLILNKISLILLECLKKLNKVQINLINHLYSEDNLYLVTPQLKMNLIRLIRQAAYSNHLTTQEDCLGKLNKPFKEAVEELVLCFKIRLLLYRAKAISRQTDCFNKHQKRMILQMMICSN